jgi:hypothetical protein
MNTLIPSTYAMSTKSWRRLAISGLACMFILGFMTSVTHAAGPQVSGKSHLPTAVANVDQSKVGLLGGVSPQNGTTYGPLYGYSYRHDWGYRYGQWKLTLNWCAVSPTSKVYVSITEVDANGNPFIGSARYTVHNVSPQNCSVNTWMNIEWGAPIRVIANYIVLP